MTLRVVPKGFELLAEWLANAHLLHDASKVKQGEEYKCPECGRECVTFYGRHTKRFFVMHNLCAGLCQFEHGIWWGATLEESGQVFESWARQLQERIEAEDPRLPEDGLFGAEPEQEAVCHDE